MYVYIIIALHHGQPPSSPADLLNSTVEDSGSETTVLFDGVKQLISTHLLEFWNRKADFLIFWGEMIMGFCYGMIIFIMGL